MSFKKGNLYTNEAKTEGIYPNTVYSAIYKDDMSKTLDADLGDLSHYNAQTITSGVDPLYLHLDMDLLWTNANPTSSFAAQTISMDLSDYSLILIVSRCHTSYDIYFNDISSKNISATLGGTWYVSGSTYNHDCRKATIANNGIVFTAPAGQNSTNGCIPYQIYGIR